MSFIGVHWKDVPLQFQKDEVDPTYGLKIYYWLVITYNPQLALVKASVLCFLLRLGGQKRWIRWYIYILNTANILLMLIILGLSIIPCWPVQYWWDKSLHGHCYNNVVRQPVTGAITVITDIMVLVIPIKILRGLQMAPRLKIALGCLLCMSSV